MPTTNYYTIDGQMIGYKDASGRKDFLTDSLGSVTAEIDQTGANKTFDGRYRPYGNSLWSSGSRGSFGWMGTLGYRSSNLKASTHYVRARHYNDTNALWTSIDSYWPAEKAYVYVQSRPTALSDPTGNTIKVTYECPCEACKGGKAVKAPPPISLDGGQKAACDAADKVKAHPWNYNRALKCMQGELGTAKKAQDMYDCILNKCTSTSAKHKVEITCNSSWYGCGRGANCAYTDPPGWGPLCVIHICNESVDTICKKGGWFCIGQVSATCVYPACALHKLYAIEMTILHELMHCCGEGNNPDHGDALAGCILDELPYLR